MKSYKIKTTRDILSAVSSKNVDGFLKDFETWLRMTVMAKELGGGIFELKDSGFTWNDDGDYGEVKSIKVEFRNEIKKSCNKHEPDGSVCLVNHVDHKQCSKCKRCGVWF